MNKKTLDVILVIKGNIRRLTNWIKKHSFAILIIGFVIYAFSLSSNPNVTRPSSAPTSTPTLAPTTLPIPTPTLCPTLEGQTNQIIYGSCNKPTPMPTPMPRGLKLTNEAMNYGSYPDYYPIYTAELHNYNCFNDWGNPGTYPSCSGISNGNYKNVIVRFSFYKQVGNCYDPANDNQYVTISDYITSGDTQTIKTPIKTSFDTSGGFRWCTSLYKYQLVP
jgi:hypothetical protein